MKLIVGLGNPGKEYVNTRHNIGYSLLDYLCSNKKIEFNNEKFDALYAEYNTDNDKIIMIKPTTYMNLSGKAVKKYMDFYKIDSNDILVVQDDLDMELGKIKFVYNSSSGGHNGIKDIEKFINTKEYLRLKIGISKDKSKDTKDYVLGRFNDSELNILNESYKKLVNLLDDFDVMNRNQLMCKYNNK